MPVGSLGLTEGGTGQRPGTTRKLAFDHARILADGLERARSKLEYTPLATSFVAEPFTISELRMVYETVWGEQLHAGNFHRKVLSVPGFVESTGETTETGGPRGGPRARLYRPATRGCCTRPCCGQAVRRRSAEMTAESPLTSADAMALIEAATGPG